MNDKVNGTVSKFNLLSEGDTVMIAFSGGADSVFLCEYLQSVKDKFKLSLKAVHVEHGIRGKESLRDCEFASEYCAKNNIECLVFHINAVEEAKAAGLGIEEYSRNKRYEIFDSIRCDKIATAHSLSDNIETVLFRLARGTSLKGLCGIPPKRGKIIRPLIEITSYEIREYLKKHNIPFCVDSTNFDNNYSRNYIRNKIIPEFKNINSEFENNVSRLIENIRENQEFLSEDTDFKSASVFCNGDLKLDKMRCMSVSEIKRIIAKWLDDNKIADINSYKIDNIYRLVCKNSRFQLTENIYAVSADNKLRIVNYDCKLQQPVYKFDKTVISVKDFLNKCKFKNKRFSFYCDCDKIIGNIHIRSRKSGDFISPQNRNCTKSLKKFFNELKIPAENRNKIPVVTDSEGIIGICGYCADERVKIDYNTKKILAINVHTEDKD